MVKRIADPTPSAARATNDPNATVDIPTDIYAEWLRAAPKE